MRVTTRSLVDNVVRQLQQNAQAVDKLQTQIASGKRISRPSDDPSGVWRSLKLRGGHDANTQHLRNMDDARNWLASEDRVLSGTNAALARMREYAVQGADASYSNNDRLAISREVSQLKEHILSLFNGTTFVGQSLFSGRQTGTQPFTVDANGHVLYAGETGVTVPAASTDLVSGNGIASLTLTDTDSAVPGSYRVAVGAIGAVTPGVADVTITRYDSLGVAVPGATQTVSVTVPAGSDPKVVDFSSLGLTLTVNSSLGSTAFAETVASEVTVGSAQIAREVGAGVNLPVNLLGAKFLTMFQDIKSLEKALQTNDRAAVAQGIANIDKALEVSLVSQAEVGTRLNRLDVAEESLRGADLETTRLQGEIESLDTIDALTRLTTQQAIYRAALEAGARTVPMSILDFLR
ncbi:MAG TPA: flagellar hook-associated protein FlgL [Chloroflexota bacterium]|nr:flagellar hook-associated protein FlgL [Chloroflexota bacterium]